MYYFIKIKFIFLEVFCVDSISYVRREQQNGRQIFRLDPNNNKTYDTAVYQPYVILKYYAV